MQEWTALGVVAAAHLGILQGIRSLSEGPILSPAGLILLGAGLAVVLAVLGISLIRRHRRLMSIKLSWIYQAEKKLGLIRKTTEDEEDIPDDPGIIHKNDDLESHPKWEGLEWPRRNSTGALMIWFYASLLLVDVAAMLWALFGA
jgi:hypothetical protein